MTKSVRMRGMNLLHFVLMVAVMTIAWLTMYSPSIAPQTAQITTTAVLLCYLVLSVFLYQTYNAYKIGMYRAGETFYSLTLANLIGNALTYLFACLIQQRLLNCVPVLFVLAAQTAISGLWCLAANQIYFKLYKPMKTLVIYKDEEDLEKLNEIVFFENRFDVIGKLRDPDDVFEILPKLQGCQAVIVSGIDATLRKGIRRFAGKEVLGKVLPRELLKEDTRILINPSGKFVLGGPVADTGLTGRKLAVDQYGPVAHIGGGALSGKDPTKVDRSGAYAARWVAKNIVAAGMAKRCEVQIAYAIGRSEPVSITVDTFGTGVIPDSRIEAAVKAVFDLTPAGIIRELRLNRPIYSKLACYGHFGRPELELPWEESNRKYELLSAALKQSVRQ